MSSHPTRRGLLALLTLLFLCMAVTPSTLAMNTRELNDPTEGDPGDGVLKPAKTVSPLVLLQTVLVTDPTTGRSAWSLPVFVLPCGLPGMPALIAVPVGTWRQFGSACPSADLLPSGGRWHDAR